MQEDRNELLAGDPQGSRMRRMQMRDAHRIGPVAMDLRVDAPLQRMSPPGCSMIVPSISNTKMFSGRTVLLSVLAPGLMKTWLVPGTRIEICPNIPMVPCKLSIRAIVAVLSRSKASSLMEGRLPGDHVTALAIATGPHRRAR